MSITNPNAKTSVFGFKISNMLLYAIIIAIVFLVVKVGSLFANVFRKIKRMLGLGGDEDVDINQEEINKVLTKDVAVQSQLTVGNRQIADQIYNSVNGFIINDNDLYSAFKKITGPNQMKAVYLAYGQRTVTIIPFYNFTGNLVAMLKWRLTDSAFNKNIGTDNVRYSIRTLLNWIK